MKARPHKLYLAGAFHQLLQKLQVFKKFVSQSQQLTLLYMAHIRGKEKSLGLGQVNGTSRLSYINNCCAPSKQRIENRIHYNLLLISQGSPTHVIITNITTLILIYQSTRANQRPSGSNNRYPQLILNKISIQSSRTNREGDMKPCVTVRCNASVRITPLLALEQVSKPLITE